MKGRPTSSEIYVRPGRNGLGVFARDHIALNTKILTFHGEVTSVPTRHSLQIDVNRHLDRGFEEAEHINHSCDPNCRIDVDTLLLISIRAIRPGGEITYHYCTTEYELAYPFRCCCGSTSCVGNVRGFKYLTRRQRRALEPYLAPHLRRLAR